MAPMPLTGTIGTTSAVKSDGDSLVSHRRSLPEPVVSFHLPIIRKVPLQPDKPTRKGTKHEQVVTPEEVNGEDNLGFESSQILLQSLRQSRLVQLTALLPYLSTRHRTAIKYHPSPPGYPYPGGLDPSTTSHSLIHLGRADLRVGPLIFPKTRFGEVRVEGGLQDAQGAGFVKTTGVNVPKKEVASSSSKPTAAPPAAAYIDDEVVKAVSVAAQKDPKLQALLHTAANGKANPDELRELAAFIQQVSAQLKAKGGSDTPNGQAAKPAAAAPTKPVASTSSSTAPTISTSASTSAAPARLVPPPQMEPPSYPPIVTVEYRENPSARFVLPLWRGCAVERISRGSDRSIKVTMLLPAIGSTAALRAEGIETKAKEGENGVSKTSPMNPPTHEQLTAPAPKGAETHAMSWLLSRNSETPLSDGIWHVFGRVSGATTTIDGQVVRNESSQADEQVVQEFVEKLKASMVDLPYTPQLRLDQEAVPRDLIDHLTDKFTPRMLTLTSKPIVKLKRGDADDEVEVVRDTNKRGRVSAIPSAEKRKRTSTNGSNEQEIDDSRMSIDDAADPSTTTSTKPKRKRHVAKHNPDGTLKLCQACGTNSTPMWRRGPSGKSTLCNACGAKWKVGRLIVSGDSPVIKGVEERQTQSVSASPAAVTAALPST